MSNNTTANNNTTPAPTTTAAHHSPAAANATADLLASINARAAAIDAGDTADVDSHTTDALLHTFVATTSLDARMTDLEDSQQAAVATVNATVAQVTTAATDIQALLSQAQADVGGLSAQERMARTLGISAERQAAMDELETGINRSWKKSLMAAEGVADVVVAAAATTVRASEFVYTSVDGIANAATTGGARIADICGLAGTLAEDALTRAIDNAKVKQATKDMKVLERAVANNVKFPANPAFQKLLQSASARVGVEYAPAAIPANVPTNNDALATATTTPAPAPATTPANATGDLADIAAGV